MHVAVSTRLDALAKLSRRFHVRRLGMFGSAARGEDFDPTSSDIDFLIEFETDADPGMAGFLDVEAALQEVVGRPVDLVDRLAIEQSRNYLRRRQILGDAEPVYVAR